MKQKEPFSKMSNWIFLPGAKRKRGVSVLSGQNLAFRLECNAARELGSCKRFRGYEVLGFSLQKLALVDKLRGNANSSWVRLGVRWEKFPGHISWIMCRNAKFRAKCMV